MKLSCPRLTAYVLASFVVLAGCSDSSTEPEPEDGPEVSAIAAASAPTLPTTPSVTLSCWNGSDSPGVGVATECPVLVWGDYTYWAFSYTDNRSSMAIVAYDGVGQVVEIFERTGARYLWQITVDDVAETVTFWGQATGTIEMTWDELRVP